MADAFARPRRHVLSSQMVLSTKNNRRFDARGNVLTRSSMITETDLCNSPDSGYGSSGNYTTPPSQTRRFRQRAFHDINGSTTEYDSVASPLAPSKQKRASSRVISLPSGGHGSRHASHSTLAHDENKICDQQHAAKLRNGNSPRIVDRFVPLRETSIQVTERYRTGKPVRTLSNLERLVRHDAVSRDPFAPSPSTPAVSLSRERDTVTSRSPTGT